jgi:putative toxin-antitoxin system antitoxin component (TIGR02293 family)
LPFGNYWGIVMAGARTLVNKAFAKIPGWCLGLTIRQPSLLHDRLLQGLPFRSVETFVAASGLKQQEILEAAQLPASTLSRRKHAKKLEPAESERLFRVAQVFERAADLFEGDAAAARRWLTEPVRGLGNRVPLELARTQVGAQLVLDLIGRTERGVFS